MATLTTRTPAGSSYFELTLGDIASTIAALQSTKVAADDYTKFTPIVKNINAAREYKIAFTAIATAMKSKNELETGILGEYEYLKKSKVAYLTGKFHRKSLGIRWDTQLEPWATLDLAGAVQRDAKLLLGPIQRYIAKQITDIYINPDNYATGFSVTLTGSGDAWQQHWFNSDWSPNPDSDPVACITRAVLRLLSRWGNYGMEDLQLILPKLVSNGLKCHPKILSRLALTKDQTFVDDAFLSQLFGVQVITYSSGDYTSVSSDATGDMIVPTEDFTFDLSDSAILKFKPVVDPKGATLPDGTRIDFIQNPDMVACVLPEGAEYEIATYEFKPSHEVGVLVDKLYSVVHNENMDCSGYLIQDVVA